MTRPLALCLSVTALGALGLLAMQIARPEYRMTGAVIVPWLVLATITVVLAAVVEEQR